MIRNVGLNATLLVTDIFPDLLHQIPLLLRVLNMTGRPQLLPTVPYSPPNRRGMLHRSATVNISIYFFNETTIQLDMAPISDFSVTSPESFTISVPFADIVFCNGSDPYPNETAVPLMIPLVAASVNGDGIFSQSVLQGGVVALGVLGLVSGSPESASAVQTLAAIGLMTCSSATTRAAVGSKAALGPLPLGPEYADIVVGNTVLVVGTLALQLAGTAALFLMKRKEPGQTLAMAAAAARCPAVTLTMFLSLYQGTVFAAGSAVVALDADAKSLGVGSAGSVVTLAAPAALAYASYCLIHRSYHLYDGTTEVFGQFRLGGPWMAAVAPGGHFTPLQVGMSFGPIVTPRLQRPFVLPVLGMLPAFALGVASFIRPSSEARCIALLSVLSALLVALGGVWLVLLPHRIPCMNVFSAISVELFALLLMLQVWNIAVPDGEVLWMTLVISMLQMILQVARIALTGVAMYLDTALKARCAPKYQWTLPVESASLLSTNLVDLDVLAGDGQLVVDTGGFAGILGDDSEEELVQMAGEKRESISTCTVDEAPPPVDEAEGGMPTTSTISHHDSLKRLLSDGIATDTEEQHAGEICSSIEAVRERPSRVGSSAAWNVGDMKETHPSPVAQAASLGTAFASNSGSEQMNASKSRLHDSLARMLSGGIEVSAEHEHRPARRKPQRRRRSSVRFRTSDRKEGLDARLDDDDL